MRLLLCVVLVCVVISQVVGGHYGTGGTYYDPMYPEDNRECACDCACEPLVDVQEGCCGGEENAVDNRLDAICMIDGGDISIPFDEREDIYGNIRLTQFGSETRITFNVDLRGFSTVWEDPFRAIHVHELSTIEKGCGGAGPIFNPSGGSPRDGDLPSLRVNSDGGGSASFFKESLKLGDVLGRSITIHEPSSTGGEFGGPIACCIIHPVA